MTSVSSRPPPPPPPPVFAVVGSGYWGKNIVRTLGELCTVAVDRVVCDSDAAARERVEQQGIRTVTSLADLVNIERLVGVFIATPAPTHYEVARWCLEHGIHTYVEKPLTLNSHQARALHDLAQRVERVLMVGHLLRYHPLVERMVRTVTDRVTFGRILYIECTRQSMGIVRDDENVLWSFCPHDVSVALALLDANAPVGHRVDLACESASESVLLPEKTLPPPLGPARNSDAVRCVLSDKNSKAQVFLNANWMHPAKQQRIVVVGDRGAMVLDDTECWERKLRVTTCLRRGGGGESGGRALLSSAEIDWTYPGEWIPAAAPLERECEHFVQCCMGVHAAARTGGVEGIRVIDVIEDCFRTARRHPVVLE